MTRVSMAQSIYNIAGAQFYSDPDENDADPSAVFTITQNGIALPLSFAAAEGFTRSLRDDLSAWIDIQARLQVGANPPGAGDIIIDLNPLLEKQNGSGGGIPTYTGGSVAFAGGRVNNVALAGAMWATIGNASSTLKLVNEAGVPITTALIAADRLSLVGSFLAVND